jgi:acetone carboxylase gamma subunit
LDYLKITLIFSVLTPTVGTDLTITGAIMTVPDDHDRHFYAYLMTVQHNFKHSDPDLIILPSKDSLKITGEVKYLEIEYAKGTIKCCLNKLLTDIEQTHAAYDVQLCI